MSIQRTWLAFASCQPFSHTWYESPLNPLLGLRLKSFFISGSDVSIGDTHEEKWNIYSEWKYLDKIEKLDVTPLIQS